MKNQGLSRRSFIAGGSIAAVASALALAGCSSSNGNGGSEVNSVEWNEETDVVVVGFGGAGASAAISASEAGASVIVLEKAPEKDAGGNTSVSGGFSLTPESGDSKDAFDFIKFQMPDTVDDEEIRGFIEECATTKQWLEDHGGNVTTSEMPPGANLPTAPGANAWHTAVGVGNGFALFKTLKAAVEEGSGVTVMYETPAVRLIFDPATKEVFGVVAMTAENETVNIKAKRGVVLACGGFENNHEMKTAYYAPGVPIFPCGTPYNTGDGIKMVQEVGAELRGFSSIEWGCHNCKPASEEIGVSLGFSWVDPEVWGQSILVNEHGQRFVNEARYVSSKGHPSMRPIHDKSQLPELAFDMDIPGYVNLPMYFICGQSKIDAGPLFNGCSSNAGNHWAHLHDWYTWSDDNQAEISKGWVTKADTLEELASKLNIDAEELAQTVATYDAACASGTDEYLGRALALSPIGDGPYYGFEMGMGLINTQGGPVRNAAHQVLNYDGEPISRLYSGGEFGSMYVWMYQGAGNIPESMGTRIAGSNAATETPWDA